MDTEDEDFHPWHKQEQSFRTSWSGLIPIQTSPIQTVKSSQNLPASLDGRGKVPEAVN